MNIKDFKSFCNKIGLQGKAEYIFNDKGNNVIRQVEYMLARSNIMFIYDGLPETIPPYELEKILQTQGFAIIGKAKNDLYALYGGLGGKEDVYYRPTKATVSIPYLNYNDVWEIGKDCIVIKNDLMNTGLLPMYLRYCTQIVEADITLILEMVNKRVQAYISASDDNTIKSAEKFLQDVLEGKQGVIADSKFFEQVKTSIVNSGSYSMRETIEVLQYLKASLYNEIGLASNYNLKKERVTYADIEMNSDNLYPLIDDMLYFRRKGIEAVNELYGLNISVQLNSSWDYRSYNGMEIDNAQEKISVNETDLIKDPVEADTGDLEAVEDGNAENDTKDLVEADTGDLEAVEDGNAENDTKDLVEADTGDLEAADDVKEITEQVIEEIKDNDKNKE